MQLAGPVQLIVDTVEVSEFNHKLFDTHRMLDGQSASFFYCLAMSGFTLPQYNHRKPVPEPRAALSCSYGLQVSGHIVS